MKDREMKRSFKGQPITIKQEDEDSFDLYVGSLCIGNYNHDEHGWDQMFAIKSLLKQLSDLDLIVLKGDIDY